MLEELEWDTLQQRRKISRLAMMHKITTGQVAIPAREILQPVTHILRHHNSKSYLRPRTNKDCFRLSFFPQTISEWNILSEDIDNIYKSDLFKQHITKHLRKQPRHD